MILELAISLAVGAYVAWKAPKELLPGRYQMNELFTILALALTAGGTVASAQASKRGQRAQREAAELERKRQDATQQRERNKVIADARRKRAEIIQAGVSAGLGTASSPVQGGAGAIQSQEASATNFLTTQSAFTDSIFNAKSRSIKEQEKGTTAGAVAQLGSTLFSAANKGVFDGIGVDQSPTPAAPTGPLTENQEIFRTTLFKG